MQDPKDTKETAEDLKKQAAESDPKKGYNESNPAQEEGAFIPDSEDESTPDEAPEEAVK